jgi:hypothetical protein
VARSYGRFTTDIWRDKKFRALSRDAQWAYFMLGTQADISAAGTLPLTSRRWAGYAIGTTPDALSDALSELEKKRFVYTDLSTEEVLVRSFVKWDGGIQNDKRRPVVVEAAELIASPKLRAILAVELRELGVTDALSDALSDSPSDATSRFDRVVVNQGEYIPQPTTRIPQPATPEGEPLDDVEPSPFCSKHPDGTEEPCGPCGTANRRHKAWVATKPAREAAKRKHADTLAALAAECSACEGTHFVLDADKHPTKLKCDHRQSA